MQKQVINTCLILVKRKKCLYIKYCDFNYQYGWDLLQSFPCKDFEFVEDLSVIKSEFIMNCDIGGNIDYTLVADLDYHVNLQPLHRDFSFF